MLWRASLPGIQQLVDLILHPVSATTTMRRQLMETILISLFFLFVVLPLFNQCMDDD